MPARATEARRLEAAFRRALARMHLAERVCVALPARAPKRAVVIAMGKAAPAMTRGALDRWAGAIERALVVTTDGTDASSVEGEPAVDILRAGHPLPDARSARAGARCLELARGCGDATLVALVSGGASALVCAPAPGVRLSDKRAVTRALLASGASIQQINVVRRHLSCVKGGGLARAAAPARVITLAASDVVDGRIEDIGSGPSVGDGSTVPRARRLLRRYAPAFEALPLVRTGPAPNARAPRIVASPEELARALARELRASGVRVRVLAPSQASAGALAREYLALAPKLRPRSAIVRAAEPSVPVPERAGRGGRSTHLATLVGRSLPSGLIFLAAATDGVDGTSGAGGALVDATFASRAGLPALDRALLGHDTGPLHLALGTALPLEPTGHNLADVHVLLRT